MVIDPIYLLTCHLNAIIFLLPLSYHLPPPHTHTLSLSLSLSPSTVLLLSSVCLVMVEKTNLRSLPLSIHYTQDRWQLKRWDLYHLKYNYGGGGGGAYNYVLVSNFLFPSSQANRKERVFLYSIQRLFKERKCKLFFFNFSLSWQGQTRRLKQTCNSGLAQNQYKWQRKSVFQGKNLYY